MATKKGAKKKATKKLSATKAASAAVESLVFSAPSMSGASLATPLADALHFDGTVHYAGVGAVLISPAGTHLLILFKPSGNYTPADIGATASHLRFELDKQEGDPLSVDGHVGTLFGQSCIFMISAS